MSDWIICEKLSEAVLAWERRDEVQQSPHHKDEWDPNLNFYLGQPSFTKNKKYRYRHKAAPAEGSSASEDPFQVRDVEGKLLVSIHDALGDSNATEVANVVKDSLFGLGYTDLDVGHKSDFNEREAKQTPPEDKPGRIEPLEDLDFLDFPHLVQKRVNQLIEAHNKAQKGG